MNLIRLKHKETGKIIYVPEEKSGYRAKRAAQGFLNKVQGNG